MAAPNILGIGGEPYTLALEDDIQGARVVQRETRPSTTEDPARPRVKRWQLGTRIGLTRQPRDGRLATDYVENLHHMTEGILTSAHARNALTLSSLDGPSGDTFFAFPFGSPMGSLVVRDVTSLRLFKGNVFAVRGMPHTVVETAGMTVAATDERPNPIVDQEVWRGALRVGYGMGKLLDSIFSVDASGVAAYTEHATLRASFQARGPDRWWGIKSDPTGVDENKAVFSLDAQLAAISNAFPIGDIAFPSTGLFTIGPFAVRGSEDGLFSFDDLGKPVRLSESLVNHQSPNNFVGAVAAFKFLYACTDTGLVAVNIETGAENPVGPNDIDGFDSPVKGTPLAVAFYKGQLWLSLVDESGGSPVSWILRGVYNPGTTPVSGKVDWYVFRKLTGVRCKAIVGFLRTDPTIMLGEDTDASWYTLARKSLDVDTYSTTGGSWHGTELIEHAERCFLRYARIFTQDCDATNTWTVQASYDGAAAATIGATITGNGLQTVRPATGGVPDAAAEFTRFKPSLVQAATNATTPPTILGDLVVEYDVIPEVVEDVACILRAPDYATWEAEYNGLRLLAQTRVPTKIDLPGETESRYGHVKSAKLLDSKAGDAVQLYEVVVTTWLTS